MLKTLKIKNFAIIDDMEIGFDNGFSVIIGETGTGKSIIIEAINLILGSRASNTMIRSGCEKSFLQAEFLVTYELRRYLDEIDIDCDEIIELTRILNINGKSSYKINGSLVNLATINKVRDLIIEIKRQSDNEISSDEFFAIKLIDKYAKINQDQYYEKYLNKFFKYENIVKKIDEIKNSTFNIDVEYIKLQIDRIEKLSTFEGEYEELIEKSKRASNFYTINELGEKIKNNLENFYLMNVEIRNLYEEFKKLGGEDFGDYTDISLQVEDFVNSFSYSSEVVGESELEHIEERIFTIKKIYDMYGGNYESVMKAYEDLNEQLYQYENGEHLLLKYEKELEELKKELNALCEHVNEKRRIYGDKMSTQVKVLLHDMYMEDAAIKFNFINRDFNIYGNCNLEILISTNNNEFLKITEIASGGERARVILALKKVIADTSEIATIIFDEIDTGVSGRVAKAMGKVMLEIAKKTQVISITHLPQVAAMSPNCLVVNKSKTDTEIVSNIEKVDGEEKVYAIAKILSGDTVSEEAILNARSLIDES